MSEVSTGKFEFCDPELSEVTIGPIAVLEDEAGAWLQGSMTVSFVVARVDVGHPLRSKVEMNIKIPYGGAEQDNYRTLQRKIHTAAKALSDALHRAEW